MRFHSDGPSIPDVLLEQCDVGNVVFLCGAGVSLPSGMPNFVDLTKYVIESLCPPDHSEIIKIFKPWLDSDSSANVPLDQIFNMLHQEYGKSQVNALVTERLRVPSSEKSVGNEHRLIKRISATGNGIPKVVTTNFDLLFEHGNKGKRIPVYVPPAFPDIDFGTPIDGITYLHGRLASRDTKEHRYVLSSADFGKAYLSQGWATKFIRGLLEHFTVVLVGYNAEDPPLKYLLQGLNQGSQLEQERLFVFDRGKREEIEAKWRDRGVKPIAYQEHHHLWRTMKSWANRVADPLAWRCRIVKAAKLAPKKMSSHERGQVAHVLRSAQGANLILDRGFTLHPEWICVLDASIRTVHVSENNGDTNPSGKYGLDDDIVATSNDDYRQNVTNDHLLEWRRGDENPPDFHRIGGRQSEGHEAIPPRLQALVSWIGKSYSSPVIAWWAARQNGLHPRLIECIDRNLRNSDGVHTRCRMIWNLVLEHHRDTRNRDIENRQFDPTWHNLKRRLVNEGWTRSVVREFHMACQPRLNFTRPVGLHRSNPPILKWGALSLNDIGDFEVKLLDDYVEDLEYTDSVIPAVVEILASQLSSAAKLLSDINVPYINTPTCYPDPKSDGGEYMYEFTKPFQLCIKLFDRLVVVNPEIARAQAMQWNEGERVFFRKLKLYALSKADLFEANEMAEIITSFTQEIFWDTNVVRELLYALVDRWHDFSDDRKELVAARIFSGPGKRNFPSHVNDTDSRNKIIAMYARYIQMRKCDLPVKFSTKLDRIIAEVPNWHDALATSVVTLNGEHGGVIEVDDTPDVLASLKPSEIVPHLEAGPQRRFDDLADPQRYFDGLVEKRPFSGLVKTNPRKALLALITAARKGKFPGIAWSNLISEFPMNSSIRLHRVFLGRLARLPADLIVKLRYSIGEWLKANFSHVLEFESNLGWKAYDHFLNCVLACAPDAIESSLGQTYRGNEILRPSLRTHNHAINSPLGMCIQALLRAVPGRKQKLIPDHIKGRIEMLLALTGPGTDHSVSILMNKLSWVMCVDPDWANENLIPMLAFDHPASEPAWNGLLTYQDQPSFEVAKAVKHHLLELYPWIAQFDWSDDVSKRAASWMASMCISRHDKPGGLTRHEMRDVLRRMSDLDRRHIIHWLGRVGKCNETGWVRFVIPFIINVWPRELSFRTVDSASGWIRLLDNTRDNFPIVFSAVRKFLIPVDIDDMLFYRFTRKKEGGEPIATQFPEEVLDLMDTLVPGKLPSRFDALPKILAFIRDANQGLATDYRYIRLSNLIDRA